MDYGNPAVRGAQVWFCSDEHLTFAPDAPVRVGDPTVALHERMHVVRGDEVLDTWAVDLRGW